MLKRSFATSSSTTNATKPKKLDCKQFYDALLANGVQFLTGVPDSLLKDICGYVTDNASAAHHIITANEGNAIGLAVGHYIATNRLACVYMQNSGFGNCVNPLLSISDPACYGVPMLLLVGWRGEPNTKDEPQHKKQGAVQEALLKAMDMPYAVLSNDIAEARTQIADAVRVARERRCAYTLLVRADTFAPYKMAKRATAPDRTFAVSREQVFDMILQKLPPRTIVVSTTGKCSRELYELRAKRNESNERDFLTIGGMGHANQIALGIALERPERQVLCLDGDGAALMHLGSLAIVAQSGARNLRHIVINNGAHDSVGGQPTLGFDVKLLDIARACGYRHYATLRSTNDRQYETGIAAYLAASADNDGPSFLEICVNKGARDDLGRPKRTPRENLEDFQAFVRADEEKSKKVIK